MAYADELRKVDVDYEYINSVYALYQEWMEDKSTKTFKKLGRRAIPLVNVYLSIATRKHNFSGSEALFDELYSYAFSTFLETVRKEKDYNGEPNAFYTYMKIRITFALQSYYMDEHVDSGEFLNEDEVEFSQMPMERGIDVTNVSDRLFTSYMEYFLSCYPDEYKKVFCYMVQYFQEQHSEITSSLLEVKFNLNENKAKEFLERGRILYRTILFFCLKEDKEPRIYLQKKGDKVMVSKYFLMMFTLEKKYPHLTELYSLLGDQTHDLIQIMGGEKLKIPTIEEMKDLNRDVSAVLDFLDNPTKEGLEEVSNKNNIDRRQLNYILKSYKKKFEDVPFLGEELKKVDEVYN